MNDNGVKFNPFLSINIDERQRPFSIKAFVDTVATFVPSVGVAQNINKCNNRPFDNKTEHIQL